MDDVELALSILTIIAIVLSILFSSYLTWFLYSQGWKRERLERLVSDVVTPLLEEIDGSVESIRESRNASTEIWSRVKNNPLWLSLIAPRIKKKTEDFYDLIRRYSVSYGPAHRSFWSIVQTTFGDFILKKDVDARGFLSEFQIILNTPHEAIPLYLKNGWIAVRKDSHENVSYFVRDFCERNKDITRASVSAEDLLAVAGKRVDDDKNVQKLVSVRSSMLSAGENLGESLHKWKDRQLRWLYGRRIPR